MTPAAAKLLMCVCAGATGASVVPVANRIKAIARPHAVVRHAASPGGGAVSAAAVPCSPVIAAAGVGGGLGPGLADNLAFPAPLQAESGFTGVVSGPGYGGAGGGIGFGSAGLPPSGGIGGGGGGLPGGGGGGGSGSASSAPEPESWALMMIGLGTLGGAMRMQRFGVARAAAR